MQINLYDYKKQLIYSTSTINAYSIHALVKEDHYYVIPNINKFKPKSLDISAGKKKEEIKLPDVKYDEKEQEENRKKFVEKEITIEAFSDFLSNYVGLPPDNIELPNYQLPQIK